MFPPRLPDRLIACFQELLYLVIKCPLNNRRMRLFRVVLFSLPIVPVRPIRERFGIIAFLQKRVTDIALVSDDVADGTGIPPVKNLSVRALADVALPIQQFGNRLASVSELCSARALFTTALKFNDTFFCP